MSVIGNKKFSLSLFLRSLKDLIDFQSLEQKTRSIVFYSEDNASFVHFETVIRELTEVYGQEVCYLTSSPNDPLFERTDPRIHTFYIDNGSIRTFLFSNLKAEVLIMTMPDLQTFYIKRSLVYPVHYVYIFHSIFSVHSYLRKGAVDYFDTVFCVGPHHVREIRETERVYELKAKNLIEFGYSRLDTLLSENRGIDKDKERSKGRRTVLIAPTYGKNSILEVVGNELIRILIDSGYFVVVRPHPMTTRLSPKVINGIVQEFQNNPNFKLELEIRSYDSLHESHCMICDWSGVSLEYAFALEKPVIYIDVPKKENNPHAGDISCRPIEIDIRGRIGEIVPLDELKIIPFKIEDLCGNFEATRNRIRQARAKTVFSIGQSGKVGAEGIIKILKEKSAVSCLEGEKGVKS